MAKSSPFIPESQIDFGSNTKSSPFIPESQIDFGPAAPQRNDLSAKDTLSNVASSVGAGLVGAGRGASAGISKYIAAVPYMLVNDTTYKDATKYVQEYYDKSAEEHPVASTAGEIVGSMAPMSYAAKGAAAVKNMVSGGKLLGKAAGVATNIGAGAAYGGVNAATNDQDILPGMAFGAAGTAAGEALGGVAKAVNKYGAKKAIQKVTDKVAELQGSQQGAAELLKSKGLDPSNLTPTDLQYISSLSSKYPKDWLSKLTTKEAENLDFGNSLGVTAVKAAKQTPDKLERAAIFKQYHDLKGGDISTVTNKVIEANAEKFHTKEAFKAALGFAQPVAIYAGATNILPALGVPEQYAHDAALMMGGASATHAASVLGKTLAKDIAVPLAFKATAPRAAPRVGLSGLSGLQVGTAALPMTTEQMFADQRARIRNAYK